MIACKCKGCKKRTMNCHDTCKDYKEFKLAIAKEKYENKKQSLDMRATKYERKIYNK